MKRIRYSPPGYQDNRILKAKQEANAREELYEENLTGTQGGDRELPFFI